MTIETLTAESARAALDDLTRLMRDAVEGGASLGFVVPLDDAYIRAYWQGVIAKVEKGTKVLLVARNDAGIVVGSAQLDTDTMPNGAHRAEVQKVAVLRSARGQGVGRQLMLAIEQAARQAGRTLLVLDTRLGNVAEQMYRKLGYVEVGVIPAYARKTDGGFSDTIFFYRTLEANPS